MKPAVSHHHCLFKTLGEDTRLYSYATQTEAPAQQVLGNKIVLLYFSASFCAPCQRFTPILQEMYRTLKATTEPPEEFEIVLCSGDTMPVPYESYATKMPWWCLPLDAGIMQRLSMEYNVQGYPHLVVLDTDGATVIRPDAVPQVLADPTGLLFPWRTRSLRDVLPAMYQRADRSYAPVSSLDDKYLLLFAAASTCPPCQRLIPHVAEVYRRLNMQRDDFEFLYLSTDLEQSGFETSLSALGCGAIPYEERQAAREIASVLHIKCLPNLLLFGPKPCHSNRDRPLLNGNVRDLFWQCTDPAVLVAEFPFLPKMYGDLNQSSDNINEVKCVVIFCETCDDEEQQEIRQALQGASQAYDHCDPLKFYWACRPTALTIMLRESLGLGPPNRVEMVLLDLPCDASFYISPPLQDHHHRHHISVKTILQFIKEPGMVRKLR